jgi:hypothetical protein
MVPLASSGVTYIHSLESANLSTNSAYNLSVSPNQDLASSTTFFSLQYLIDLDLFLSIRCVLLAVSSSCSLGCSIVPLLRTKLP